VVAFDSEGCTTFRVSGSNMKSSLPGEAVRACSIRFSGFIETLYDLDAYGGVVGLPFEDLIGAVVVDGSLHRCSAPSEGQLHIAVSFVGEFAEVFIGRQTAIGFGLGFHGHSSERFRLVSPALVKLLGTSHGKLSVAVAGGPRGPSWPS
jgi:hypothetical protein